MNVVSARSDKLSSEFSDILFEQGMEIANYELMVVAASGEGSDGFFKKLEGFLNDAKVSKLKAERLGKKPLAYQISKQKEGEYAIYTFEATSDVPQSLLTMIKLEQDLVLRYLITRVKEVKASKVTKVKEAEEKPDVEEKKAVSKVKVEAKEEATKVSKVKKAKKK